MTYYPLNSKDSRGFAVSRRNQLVMTYPKPSQEEASIPANPWPARNDEPLVAAVQERSPLQNELYVRYRRPLLQILLQRRIPRDAVEDLLQRTFEQRESEDQAWRIRAT